MPQYSVSYVPTEEPWKRQPWDTNASYAAFREFFLSQSPPRTLNQAYRLYAANKRGLEGISEEVAGLRPPGTWNRWYRAEKETKDQNGKKHIVALPGALTWDERVRAFDELIAAQAEAKWVERGVKVREDDWGVSELLRDAGVSILAVHDKFLVTRKKFIKGDAKQGVPDKEIVHLKLNTQDGLKMLQLASDLGRKSAMVEDAPTRVVAEIDREINYIFEVLENVLDSETYEAVVKALQQD